MADFVGQHSTFFQTQVTRLLTNNDELHPLSEKEWSYVDSLNHLEREIEEIKEGKTTYSKKLTRAKNDSQHSNDKKSMMIRKEEATENCHGTTSPKARKSPIFLKKWQKFIKQ